MGEKVNPVVRAARQSLRQNTPSAQRSIAAAVRNNTVIGRRARTSHPAKRITSVYSIRPDGRFPAESASRHPGGGRLLSPMTMR